MYLEKRFLFFLLLSSLFCELVVLYIQHIRLLKPCVLCVYQRCTLYVLILSGLILFLTKRKLLRFISLIFLVGSSWKGLLIAIKQTKIHFCKCSFLACDVLFFPYWLPLDNLLPAVFSATGDCFEHQLIFFSLAMSQWMIVLFVIYLFIAVSILLTYFFEVLIKKKHRDY